MIITELVSLYERLDGLPRFGFTTQRIDYRIVVNPDGSLHDISPMGEDGVLLDVPHPGGKRTSALKPYFSWDKADYALGRNLKDEAKGNTAVVLKRFAAFKQLHLSAEPEISDPDFSVLCRFLENWNPSDLERLPEWQKLTAGTFVFQITGKLGYLHDLAACRGWWEKTAEALTKGGAQAQCLVTGSTGSFELTHLPIKGVADKPGKPSEKALVSVNKDKAAFESYGKKQGANSPISPAAAFKYVTSLNWLLRWENNRKITLGDTTVVFWTARPTATETFFADAFGGVPPGGEEAQDAARLARVQQFLATLRAGGGRAVPGDDTPDTPFYLLGLAPNAARLSIRFWQVSTLGDLAAKLAAHYEALCLVREYDDTARRPDPEFPSIRDLLDQTAAVRKDGVDRDTIPPLLGGALLRAVLTGAPYPHAFASAILRRIRADGRLTYLRCAALKAFLTRHLKITMNEALDPNRPESAYHLGRLFAVYETAQKHAHDWKLERTIRETMYSAASATPLAVFGRLERMFHHHTREKRFPPGSSETYAEIVGEISQRFTGRPIYPPTLDLPSQALFAVGYYHQLHHLRGLQEAKRTEAQPAA